MITKKSKEILEKQGYRVVGNHSAVKTCGWTKKTLRDEGGCYKLKFYGIKSHKCMQMTTSISCANRCTFCWRDYKAEVSKDWIWGIDDPQMILDNSIIAHNKLLVGFKGNPNTSKKLYEESTKIEHVALSLTGEPITYPKINELITKFHKNKISTFIVTNGQFPKTIKDLIPITQLYLSVDAPNKELLKKIDVPLFSNYWERLLMSLDNLKNRTDRTAIRLTLIKNLNMVEPENYANLIKKGGVDFIEIKGYMWVGASQQRLKYEDMPNFEEIKEFAKEVLNYLDEYELVNEHYPSNVILLAKKLYKKNTLINFDKLF